MKVYTRQQYINGECTHDEFYAPFITKRMKQIVLQRIGMEQLNRSEDEHLNDIPLHSWESLPYIYSVSIKYKQLTGDYLTVSGWVCLYKQAAKQLMEK